MQDSGYLFSSDDVDIALLINLGHIARSKPAAIEAFESLGLVPEIPV